MAYIGRGIENFSQIEVLDNITFTNSAGPYNILKGAVAFVPSTINSLLIEVDGIIQAPSSYTINGSTITFGVSMASTSTMNSMIHFGSGLITTPADNSVTAAKIANNAVTTAKILDNNVTVAKLPTTLDISGNTVTLPASVSGLGTGITNAQLAGSITDAKITGLSSSKLSGLVPTANLGSGTASSSTILYGDQTYKAEPTTDLTPLRQDIITLALKQGVQENMTKHNLPSSAVVTFQEDADFDLAGSTDISRTTDKYIWAATGSAGEFSNDSNTKLLMHFDGVDGSTTFTDSSSGSHSISGVGGAQLDTAQKKFGTASLLLDGNSDGLSIPASSDWVYGTGDFTIEWWVRFNDLGSANISFYLNGTHDQSPEIWVHVNYNGGSRNLRYEMLNASGTRVDSDDTAARFTATNTWYHCAITRDGSNMRTYIDGVQVDSNAEATGSYGKNAQSEFGYRDHGGAQQFLDGWIDEVRFSNTCRYPNGTTFTPNSTVAQSATGTALGTTNVPSSAVTEVSGVMLLENASGTNTLGTDVKVYFTADNSSWTEAASYTDAGTFSSGVKQITLGKTTVSSGSDVRWKIAFANQAAGSKVAKIHGIGTNY